MLDRGWRHYFYYPQMTFQCDDEVGRSLSFCQIFLRLKSLAFMEDRLRPSKNEVPNA